MSQLITPRYQSFELIVPAGAGAGLQVNFQQIPQLQSFYLPKYLVFLLALENYSSEAVPFSPYNQNLAVATFQDCQNAFLTLVRIGDEAHQKIPLVDLTRHTSQTSQTQYVREPFRLPDEWQIDWTKSYLQLVKTPISTPPFTYFFGAHYSYYPQEGSGIAPQPWHFTGVSRQR